MPPLASEAENEYTSELLVSNVCRLLAGVVGHAARVLSRQILDFGRPCRHLVEPDDLMRLDRLQGEFGLIDFRQFLKARRLRQQAPVGLEKSNGVFLELDLGFDPAHLVEPAFRIVLDLVGGCRRRDHYGDENDVAGTKHFISPPAAGCRVISEGRKSSDRRHVPPPRCEQHS